MWIGTVSSYLQTSLYGEGADEEIAWDNRGLYEDPEPNYWPSDTFGFVVGERDVGEYARTGNQLVYSFSELGGIHNGGRWKYRYLLPGSAWGSYIVIATYMPDVFSWIIPSDIPVDEIETDFSEPIPILHVPGSPNWAQWINIYTAAVSDCRRHEDLETLYNFT